MELSEKELDIKKIDEGDWIHVPALDSDLFVKGLRSEEFRRKLSKRTNRAKRNMPTGELDSVDENQIYCKTLVDCDMVSNWRPLTDDHGKTLGKGLTDNGAFIPFTRKLFVDLMGERRWEEVQAAVTIACSRVGKRDDELREADLGNSGEGSEAA